MPPSPPSIIIETPKGPVKFTNCLEFIFCNTTITNDYGQTLYAFQKVYADVDVRRRVMKILSESRSYKDLHGIIYQLVDEHQGS